MRAGTQVAQRCTDLCSAPPAPWAGRQPGPIQVAVPGPWQLSSTAGPNGPAASALPQRLAFLLRCAHASLFPGVRAFVCRRRKWNGASVACQIVQPDAHAACRAPCLALLQEGLAQRPLSRWRCRPVPHKAACCLVKQGPTANSLFFNPRHALRTGGVRFCQLLEPPARAAVEHLMWLHGLHVVSAQGSMDVLAAIARWNNIAEAEAQPTLSSNSSGLPSPNEQTIPAEVSTPSRPCMQPSTRGSLPQHAAFI